MVTCALFDFDKTRLKILDILIIFLSYTIFANIKLAIFRIPTFIHMFFYDNVICRYKDGCQHGEHPPTCQ